MMLEKIDVSPIVRDHMATLRSHRTKERSIGDLLVQWIFPAVVALVAGASGVVVSKEAAAILAAAISIFGGLLFNLMMLVYGIVEKTGDQAQQTGISVVASRKRLLEEIFANITFGIVIAVVTVIFLVIATWEYKPIARMIAVLVIFHSQVFALALLMIVRRAYLLMRDQFIRI